MTTLKCLSAVAVAVLTATAAQAAVMRLSDPAQMSGVFVNDFEIARDAGEAHFNSGSFRIDSPACCDSSTSSGAQVLVSANFPEPITATLSSSTDAVGMYFGNDDPLFSEPFDAVLSAYAGDTLLGSVSVTANMNDYADQFIGLSSSTAFDRVSIAYTSADLYVVIDDFRVAAASAPAPSPSVVNEEGEPAALSVPEPASLALVGLALVAYGALRRRKR